MSLGSAAWLTKKPEKGALRRFRGFARDELLLPFAALVARRGRAGGSGA